MSKPREPKQCDKCGEYIFFMKTRNGKWMPVDVESVDDISIWEYDSKRHMSHFDTCKARQQPEAVPDPEPQDTGDEWPDEGVPF